MALVFDRPTNGPGTHALLIGVGGYPRTAHFTLPSASPSVLMISQWLRESFRNPTAELASIDLLASEPGEPRPRGATFGEVQSALLAWRERANDSPENVALLYFIGRGFPFQQDILLTLDDYSERARSEAYVSLDSIRSLMRSCQARRQLFLVDTERRKNPSPNTMIRTTTYPESHLSRRPEQSVILCAPPAEIAFQTHDTVSVFARGLIGSLNQQTDDSESGAITVRRLASEVGRQIAALASNRLQLDQYVASEITEDFDFHFPALGPLAAPPDQVAEDASAQQEGKAGQGAGADPVIAKKRRAGGETKKKSPPRRNATQAKRGARLAEESASEAQDETSTDFVLDDAELDQDRLDRSVLAIGLARRLHKIWSRTNDPIDPKADPRAAHEGSRAAFVVHLDAPWGGGKTTFANFLARILNPWPSGGTRARFLRDRYGDADLGGIFLDDPDVVDVSKISEECRRPWITVYFNAWQAEHIRPPWWVFYQSIRQGCFDAVKREGTTPWTPKANSGSGWRKRMAHALFQAQRRLSWIVRFDHWLSLWAKEFLWRISNPKIRSLFATAILSLGLVMLLSRTGLWGIIEKKGGEEAGVILGSPVGLLLTGVGSITGLWALAALFTESIVPGTDTLAERLNLGNGDPFSRFRRHFAKTIRRVRRPVLVIIDDLDRCGPEFVVDLIRGIQTLLRSPRVVFIILGDRDWIERAFESRHESMSKVDVGPEQTFGARFVEKAIQMSFILPALGDEARLAYVRHVLLGDRAERQKQAAPQLAPAAAAKLREFVNIQAARPDISVFDSARILDKAALEFWPFASGDAGSVGSMLEKAGAFKDSPELERIISETLAIRAASDEDAEREIIHELQRFASFFPANPRQIKRVINSITIYYAVAIQRPDIQPDEKFRSQLTLWVIIMTEWPETWRLLASFPDLVTFLTAPDPVKAIKRRGLDLPGSIEATAKALETIQADRDLMALITGKGQGASHDPLETEQVRKLAQLTPLHSRKRWLGDLLRPTT